MVVHDDQCSGVDLDQSPNDLARIDRRVADRAAGVQLVEDKAVLRVEEQQPDNLTALMRQRQVQIIP